MSLRWPPKPVGMTPARSPSGSPRRWIRRCGSACLTHRPPPRRRASPDSPPAPVATPGVGGNTPAPPPPPPPGPPPAADPRANPSGGITMPTFDTPEPISAVIDLVVGDARITASDRGDTVVEIRPSDASHDQDVRAAEQTRVEYAAGRLLVRAPRQRSLSIFGKPGSIDVTIDLPAGPPLHRAGSASLKTSFGEIEVGIQAGTAARLDVHTEFGHIRNQMDASESPGPSDQTVEVRARTSYGDIVIHRS